MELMKKTKRYINVKFSPETIKEAVGRLLEITPDKLEDFSTALIVEIGEVEWNHTSEEEFFSDYRQSCSYALYKRNFKTIENKLTPTFSLSVIFYSYPSTKSKVEIEAPERKQIETIFGIFEKHLEASRLPAPKPLPPPPSIKPIIFIGHGKNPLWRDLKDHLHEKHKFDIEAYEIGERAGHTIRDILEKMMLKSAFALLVMTGEDETKSGEIRARENVIHELGLFQGKLGFHRAIALLEEGTNEFSNIQGIQQIRFSKGNIKETYGDIIATLTREFGDKKKP